MYHLSIIDYNSYMNSGKNSRTVIEGEELVNANHLTLCGITKKSHNSFSIYALCLQTSALLSQPHTIEGSFDIGSRRALIHKFICSCKAGNGGRCKHISAVLIYCMRCRKTLNLYIARSCFFNY
jgi:hypothetical protein